MSRMNALSAGLAIGWVALQPPVAAAATFSTVYTFQGNPDGNAPSGNLVVLNGSLFGTTYFGGNPVPGYPTWGYGTVYTVNLTTGVESVLHRFELKGFDRKYGSWPLIGLYSDGMHLYGENSAAYHHGQNMTGGLIFAIDPNTGVETVPAYYPVAGLAIHDGRIYAAGNLWGERYGSIYRTGRSSSKVTTITEFSGTPGPDFPAGAPIFVGKTIYGATEAGGANIPDEGTIYKVDPATGAVTVLYSFIGGTSGAYPVDDLIFHEGALYGITSAGGGSQECSSGCGTIFKFDLATQTLTTLHAFSGAGDGAKPEGRLLIDHGKLYGTTYQGGNICSGGPYEGCGTIFQVDLSGSNYKVLHKFEGQADGASPAGGMVACNGKLYGTTQGLGGAGPAAHGTVFSITP